MALSYDIAGAQIDGAREYQEDSFLITHMTDTEDQPSALVIVADGMGGHAAGNVASNLAVQATNKYITSHYPSESPSEILNNSILKANQSIADTVRETPALEGMGCTMVAVIIEGGKLWWASVGDSHLYLLRDRELTKINADHSYGGFLDRMAAAGTPVEAEPGLSRNMLMSAINGSDIAEIDCPGTPQELKNGDKILICSDGMDTLSRGKVIQYTDWSETSKECAEALLNAVEEAEMPKQDNTTVVVINVLEKAAAEAAAKAPAAAPEAEEAAVEEDEDITDPAALAKAAEAEAPAGEIEEIELAGREAVPGEAPPAIAPAPAAVTAVTPPEPARKTGLIIGIAAGVAVAVGAFLLLGKKEIGAPEELEPAPTAVTEPEAEVVHEAEPEAEPIVEAPEPAEPEVEPAVEAPVVTEAPPVSPPVDRQEFQDALKAGGLGPVMVWIPAGTFEMGSSGASRFTDERPRHTVTVKRFAMSKHEIIFAEYDRFAKATGRRVPDDLYLDRATHPVILVSWDDAYYYAKWLSEQTGHKYRLPTEAEWEYAAAGGRNMPFWWGFEEQSGKAHCFGCGSSFDPRKPTRVGSFDPNPFGLHDTSGNVAEWVHDCWHDTYNGAPTDGSVWEGGNCSLRVARGGSYISPQQSLRVTKRDKFKSDNGYDHIGIRLVREE